MQRSTMIFLVLLRLAIGWHFLFEGIPKIRSVIVGETATKRPFSSASYFREAPGPLGSVMRRNLGDPDEEALARLTVVPRGADVDPAADKAHERVAPALKKDWETLSGRYARHYSFDADQLKAADIKLAHAFATLMGWLEYRPAPVLEEIRSRFGRLDGVDTAALSAAEKHAYQAYLDNTREVTIEVTLAVPPGKVTKRMTAAERLELYRKQLAELGELSRTRPGAFGKDVDGQRARQELKGEITRLRGGLVADLDGHTKALMAALNQVAAGSDAAVFDRLSSRKEKAEKDKLTSKLKDTVGEQPLGALLATLGSTETATDQVRTLKPTDAARLKIRPLDGPQLRTTLTPLAATLDKNVKAASEAASQISNEKARDELKALTAAVGKETKSLPEALEGLPKVDPLLPVPEGKLLSWIDWTTRWGLTIGGACLLIGLFTRLNCVLLAGFLLTTTLLVPSVPWLPAAGPSEGNYLFINKNIVEMLALLVLATTASGRWFGVDAILYRMRVMIFGETKATTSPER